MEVLIDVFVPAARDSTRRSHGSLTHDSQLPQNNDGTARPDTELICSPIVSVLCKKINVFYPPTTSIQPPVIVQAHSATQSDVGPWSGHTSRWPRIEGVETRPEARVEVLELECYSGQVVSLLTEQTFELTLHAGRNAYQLLTSAIVPRPIAFVATESADGVPNLAPMRSVNSRCCSAQACRN